VLIKQGDKKSWTLKRKEDGQYKICCDGKYLDGNTINGHIALTTNGSLSGTNWKFI